MAASFNKVLLMGNLTRDPELRFIPSGQAVATFSIAVNRTYLAATGEKKEEVTFVRVVVWGKRAELCHEYLKKGYPAFVEGRLQSRSWDAPDGTKRSTIEVIAQNVQFLGRPKSAAASHDDKLAESIPAPEGEAIIEDSFDAHSNFETKQSSSQPNPSEEVPF